MAEHEPSIGLTSDWYTPPSIFSALGLVFDLDPCSPGPGHWVRARKVYTEADDGLWQHWTGSGFMNATFGGRGRHDPWARLMLEARNRMANARAYTSSHRLHEYAAPGAESLLCPKGKTKFHRPIRTAPGHGVALIGMGAICNEALKQSGLGWFVDQTELDAQPPRVVKIAPGPRHHQHEGNKKHERHQRRGRAQLATPHAGVRARL